MVKLTIDQMIDPQLDVVATLEQIDAIVAQVNSLLPTTTTAATATSHVKLAALRTYLYHAGPWNDHRPFSYDLDDPLGHKLRNKLLPVYLTTRKGNCISMPFLFIILGQKLGLDVTATTAPNHVLVKYRDDTGRWFNIEATSGGGFARDVWVQQQMSITSQALSSGIYLQPLTKRQTLVLMLCTLVMHYQHQGWYKDMLAVATLALPHHPNSVNTMLALMGANARLWDNDCVRKYPQATALRDIPMPDRAVCLQYNRSARYWRSKAKALGWRYLEPEDEAAYLQRVTQEKAAQRAAR